MTRLLNSMTWSSCRALIGLRPRLVAALSRSQRTCVNVLQSFELVLPALPNFAFASASLYRLSRDEAYCQFFKVAWRSAYRSLALLFGPVCDGATALQLTGRLLAASPSADPTASLDASVTLLLAHLDTPVLRTASASDRATAMSALLKAPAPAGAGSGSSSIGGTPASSGEGDTVMWARVFAQPVTVALFALLDALNVIPIVEYRLARLLLGDPSPIGIHFIVNGTKVPNALFRSIKAAATSAATLQALQRKMCVAAGNLLMLDWFSAFDSSSADKLYAGKWTIGVSSSSAIDPWTDYVSRLYAFQHGGPHVLQHLHISLPTPQSFFSNEFALRVGGPILVQVWETIGFASSATLVGSLAWVLSELQTRATAIAYWPGEFEGARQSCAHLL